MPPDSSATGLVWEAAYRNHHTGLGHPEGPHRMDAVQEGLGQAGLLDLCLRIEPRPALDAELLACHTPAYLEQVRRDVQAGRGELSTGDTAIGPASETVARLAAGGVLAAVDAVIEGRVRNAFAAVRPPGHHASAARGMGFCIYNSIAIAARHLQVVHGLERVLIVDWDVHHGNGTQSIFWSDPTVLFFSTHQMPLYPGTGASGERGEGAGEGFTINCPLRSGDGGNEVIRLMERHLIPAAEVFAPEMVLVSAGFDGRTGDPLGGLRVTDGDFTRLTLLVRGIAERHAGGRLVSCLEGGYDHTGLALACAAHVRGLLGR